METTNITPTEREAILMMNAYGVNVAIKQCKTQQKFYQFNPVEYEYWVRVENALHGIQNHALVA